MELVTDGSLSSKGIAASACIIRSTKEFLPIKLVAYLGNLESSQAELWSAIIGFTMIKLIKDTNQITWTSDSKTTLNYFSKNLNSKQNAKHYHEWKLIDDLTKGQVICCHHRLRTTKFKDLLACDRASRWVSSLGEDVNNQKKLLGQNSLRDPRYAWQVVNLQGIINGECAIENLMSRFSDVEISFAKC